MDNASANKKSATISYDDFAGSEACQNCHKDIYKSHTQTAHFLSLRQAAAQNILGSFENDKNEYFYQSNLKIKMEHRDSGFYQVVYFNGEEKKVMQMDMTIGSGTMGQSFLSWRGNKLFQLPITYFTAAGQWANSPGLRSDKVVMDKPVTTRCLECHTTYAEAINVTDAMEPMEFDHKKIMYEIGCEKCHGAGKEHINFHNQNPNEKIAKFIVNPNRLSRQQQLDVCALCHGGNMKKTTPSFQFSAGNNLADYFLIDTAEKDLVASENIDVHGNNYGLLKASKCFKNTTTLTCNTCHNSHEKQRGNIEMFSQKCISCHNVQNKSFQTAAHASEKAIEKNCIDCHMPAQPSKSIAVKLENEDVLRASFIRTHLIGIYKLTNSKK
jgi:hypothetical protein